MVRIGFGILLLLLSMLALFRAPTNFFWRVAVAVTEFPWVFILAALLLFACGFLLEKYKITALLISGAALVIFCVPVVRAYTRGADLKNDLAAVFPGTEKENQLQQPFSFWKMFSGIQDETVTPQVLPYKQLEKRALMLDYFSSSAQGKFPCVVIVHGGSWSSGDSKQLPELNSYLANHGYNVAAINYRLAPEYKSPAPVEDVRDAIRYLKDNAEKLNIDTNNFILLGRSAGGQIALCAAYTMNDPTIKGVISYYAPADMVWGAKIKGNPLVLNTDDVFAQYLGGPYDQFAQKYHESSACEHVKSGSAPTLIVHGEIDAMVAFEHSNRLNKKLEAFHVPHYFLNLPGSTHGCDYNLSGPSGQVITFAVERFIAGVTNKE